jgi:hypothetical protein
MPELTDEILSVNSSGVSLSGGERGGYRGARNHEIGQENTRTELYPADVRKNPHSVMKMLYSREALKALQY